MNQQREKEDSYDCFLFCKKHKNDGVSILQTQGSAGLQPIPEKEYRNLYKQKKKTQKKGLKKVNTQKQIGYLQRDSENLDEDEEFTF